MVITRSIRNTGSPERTDTSIQYKGQRSIFGMSGVMGVGCVKVFRYYYLMLPRQKTVSPVQGPLLTNDSRNSLKGIYKCRTQFERDKQDLICEILNKNISKVQMGIRMKEREEPPSRAYHEQPFIKFQQPLKYPQQTKTQDKGYLPNRQRAQCIPAEQQLTYFDQYIRGLKKRQHQNLVKTEYPQTDSDESFQFISHFIKTPKPQTPKITLSSANQSKGPLNDIESTAVISKFYRSSHPTKLRKTEASSHLSKTNVKEASNKSTNISLPTVPLIQHQIRKFALDQRTDHSAEKTVIQASNKTEERPSVNELTINKYEKTVKSPKINLQMALEDKIKGILKQEASAAHQRVKQSSQVYNYDQQSNIFTKFPEKPQKSPQQQIKKSVKEVKEVFKIRDQQRFKRELKQEEERLNKIEIKKKPKSDIFGGCAQLSYRKYFSRQNSTPPRQQSSHQQSENIPTISHKDSGPIKYSEQKQGALGSKPNPAISKSHSIVESSQGSFMQEKQQVTQKQVESISNMVSSAVQAVASNIRRLINNKDTDILPPKQIIDQQQGHKVTESAPQLKHMPSEPIRPEQRPMKPQSTSKVFGVAAEKKAQQSIDFFANLPSEMQSNNSTIKQVSSKSDDRSQVMMQLRELESYSIDSQVFKKDTVNHIPQSDIPLSGQKKQQGSKQLQRIEEAYQPIYASISQYRPSHEINNHLQEIEISQDAISLSKFADAVDSNLGPSIFQISFEQPKKQPTANGKVKRIEIDLDSDSFEAQPNEPFQLPDEQGEVDLDDLQDYESDEQAQPIPTQNRRVKEPFPKTLTPVLEEDLEESQYNKLQKKKSSLKQSK